MGEEAPVSYAEPGPPCILFIRFHEDCLQRLKNSLTQGKSVLKIHGGEMIGIGEQVYIVDGEWPGNKLLAAMVFESIWKAQTYFDSAPKVKQQDWLTETDFVAFPIQTALHPGRRFFVFADYVVCDGQTKRFKELMGEVGASIEEAGASAGVAAERYTRIYRGSWELYRPFIHQFDSEQQFRDWYKGEAYQKCKEKLQGVASVDMIVFTPREFLPVKKQTDTCASPVKISPRKSPVVKGQQFFK